MPIEQSDLKQLKGRTALEVVSLLPTFPWHTRELAEVKPVVINGLTLVSYDTSKPRRHVDMTYYITGGPGAPIPPQLIDAYLSTDPERTTAIASLAYLDTEVFQATASPDIAFPKAHIPFIDMDLDYPDLSQEEVIMLIKKEIRVKTEIERGVIIASGGRNHFHFMGLDRLLTQEQFTTFLGLCGNMRDDRFRQIVDMKWLCHAQTPMSHVVAFNNEWGTKWSAYDLAGWKFATLRFTSNAVKSHEPVVIDVL